MTKKIFPIFFLTLFCIQCESNQVVDSIDLKPKSEQEKLQSFLHIDSLKSIGIPSEGIALLQTYYQSRNYQCIWYNNQKLTQTGQIVQQFIQTPIAFGLPAKRYQNYHWDKSSYLKNELITTAQLLEFQFDLNNSILDSEHHTASKIQFPKLHEIKEIAHLPNTPLELASQIIQWGSADTNYQALAIGLFNFAFTHPMENKILEVKTEKEDSILGIQTAKFALQTHGFIDTLAITEINLRQAIRSFQKSNALFSNGIIDESTALALQESNLHRCRRIAVTLEKWKQTKKYPPDFIRVNIPEFTLNYYQLDTLRSVHKVIVGKIDHQTPTFNASMYAVVLFPFWNVPYSISSKEFLPQLKHNSGYLEQNHIKIFRKNQELNSRLIAWKKVKENTFPYKVIQEPGKFNSLGIIKFEFNNKYGVYIHDTPSKRLFNAINRAFSHGCIRCQNPIDFAKQILVNDSSKFSPQQIDSLLAENKNFTIPLQKRIPIFIEYKSVGYTKDKTLIYFKDIYLKDEKLIQELFNS
jgi:murein L,D-transpeptidase YcbB/YkuD